jgi:hypothetical protein
MGFSSILLVGLLAVGQADGVAESPVARADRERVEVVARVAQTVVAIFGPTGGGGGSGV